jgi:succinate dehydrogenase / fumarate reductase, cytochrome b subunit
MSSSPPNPKPRPLSPHLQIYRPQLTSVLSILHRATGVGLCAALPIIVWWLVSLSNGAADYAMAMSCLGSPVGKLLLMGWSWALCYHLCTGVRHLLWDVGLGLEIQQVYQSGKIALGVSAALTLVLWLVIWGA